MQAQAPLKEKLKGSPFKIAYECYVNDNWEIFVMNPDGSGAVNLTHTPDQNEHYPQISPDGSKISFTLDEGEGREAVRSLYVMDIDGKNRKKLVDHAREQFWSPDSKIIGFLPQEYPKFNVIDFYTKGMSFYDLATGKIEPHQNSTNLHHLYNPSWSANGKWIAATVHAGMGVGHAILLIEAHGDAAVDFAEQALINVRNRGLSDRILEWERVIASTDCGLGGRVHPQIAWAKLEALAQGAALATRQLWR